MDIFSVKSASVNTTHSDVAIIGAGIAGILIAYRLTRNGYNVTLFEKGPDYPYPHVMQFTEQIRHLHDDGKYLLDNDLKHLEQTGSYGRNLDAERHMMVGGMATHWQAITPRMHPHDFATQSLFGYGVDWPLTYSDVEPYYCEAESMLGVSGTDSDNPFARWRSQPYPMEPFELSYEDRILAARLREQDLVLHTTPQARNRSVHQNRPACQNYGTCAFCPIGARYSPAYHLGLALQTGQCRIYSNTSIRKIVADKSGRARTLVYQHNDETNLYEHSAKVFIVAAGTIESARLLLLSYNDTYVDGLGNAGGAVGANLTFHHLWQGQLHYAERFFPGRFGGWTGQSDQFLSPDSRGKHGSIKVEFSSRPVQFNRSRDAVTRDQILEQMRAGLHWRPITLHAESIGTSMKRVSLSKQTDRFGDPFAHVAYESSEFDYMTYGFARQIIQRFAAATKADDTLFSTEDDFGSGHHHMGACRMGQSLDDSVVDSFGRVHGMKNLFLAGASTFVNSSGGVNPTLTIAALALRTADYIQDRAL